MANQSQTAFDEGTFTFDGTAFGITDITLGEETSELDVSDTETESGESEFIYGKTSRPISFTAWVKAGTASLATKVQKAFTLECLDENGGYTLFSGNATLGTKSMTGSRDGAFSWQYNGRIQGALVETQHSES